MSESLIKDKSFNLAIRIVKMYGHLKDVKKEYVMSKQVLRSGTSIGANIREALNGESKADFIHKLAISQKEADETLYWLELLRATGHIEETSFASIHSECTQLLRMIKSVILTTKQNLKKTHNS